MFIGLMAGVLWALDTVVLSKALSFYDAILIAPLVAAFLHDTCSFLYLTVFHGIKRDLLHIFRSIRTKEGKRILFASLLGGPLGMSGYVSAIFFMGPGFTAAFSSLYPAFGALISHVFFHEKLSKKQVAGMALSLSGVAAMSLTPNASVRDLPVGLACAALCMVCWGLEGVLVQQGMKNDAIQSDQALWMRQGLSALVYGAVVMNVISGWDLAANMIVTHHAVWIVLAALAGTASYLCYYAALHRIGPAKAMSLNITYVAWSIGLSFLLLKTVPSFSSIFFALIVLLGAIFSSS